MASISRADRHVGEKMAQRRRELGMMPEQLAAAIGVTEMELIAYERGEMRPSAGRLLEAATALLVSLSYFFEGI